MDEHRYEHSRTRLGALPSRAWDVMGPRMLRPLIGGAVGAAIVVLFLAIRGGDGGRTERVDGHGMGRLESARGRASVDCGECGGGGGDCGQLRG